MLASQTFISGSELDYIPVSGVVAGNVIRVQRNGIGLRFQDGFDSAPVDADAYSFEWLGVDSTITLDSGAYIIPITNSVTSFRTVVYEFGPTVGVGYVYVFVNGTQQAQYAAAPLDNAEDVRDGVEAALNAVSWTGFTITTLALGTNRLRVTFSNTEDFTFFIGRTTYKAGYYCTISGIDYLIYYDDSPTGYPVLPALDPSYNFLDLTEMGDIEDYLAEPFTVPVYSETFEDVVSISEVPGSSNVPDQFAVIDEANQRVYFWENLNIGEVIKIMQK